MFHFGRMMLEGKKIKNSMTKMKLNYFYNNRRIVFRCRDANEINGTVQTPEIMTRLMIGVCTYLKN